MLPLKKITEKFSHLIFFQGCDGTTSMTSNKRGFLKELEILLGHALLWVVYLLHFIGKRVIALWNKIYTELVMYQELLVIKYFALLFSITT